MADAAPVDPPQGQGEGPDSDEEGHKHVFYAVELLIFVLVGWGWLAIREYLGGTPVMDVVVVISLTVSTAFNLAVALLVASTEGFRPFARAYFTHCLVLWGLYVYSLAESLRLDPATLCCTDSAGVQSSAYSIGPSHANAFFGGLPFHQVPAAVTEAFLTVMLLVASAQARACKLPANCWLMRGLGVSIASVVTAHLGVFLMGAPICGRSNGVSSLTVIVAGLVPSLIIDYEWVVSHIFIAASVEMQRMRRFLRSVIHASATVTPLFYCMVVGAVSEKTPSGPLIIALVVALFASVFGLSYEAVMLFGSQRLGVEAWKPDDAPAAGRVQRGRTDQEVRIPAQMARSRSVDYSELSATPLLRRYPVFLQGQQGRVKKGY